MASIKRSTANKVDKALDAFEGLLAVGFAATNSVRQNRELAAQAVEHFGEAIGELFTKDNQGSSEDPEGE